MTYEVLIKPAAQRQLKKLPRAVQADLITLIEHLTQDPRPPGWQKAQG